jgi:predicted ATP-grasp superfamily ATP-dependent carboligase
MVARTPAEAISAYRDMDAAERSNLMLQEYIPGGPDSVWMFNGYFDEHSECLVGFTGKKIRQSPPYTGATSLGVCIWNASVAETTTEFMKAIGYRGILDIGYRFDARDGQYKLLDVNPRVGSTFRLFVDPTNGMDVVRALYLDLTGQTVPRAQQREGRRWVVEPWDMRSSIEYRKDGRLTVRDWLRSFRNVEEAAWFAVDDLVPPIRMSARLSANALRKSARRVGEAIRGRHAA